MTKKSALKTNAIEPNANGCVAVIAAQKNTYWNAVYFTGIHEAVVALQERIAQKPLLRLQGMTFGELKVLAVADNHPKDTRGGVWWHCRCSCGKEIDVLASLLATGKKTHCGCKSEPNYYFVDITDKTFNMLTAKYIVERKHGKVIWHCVWRVR